MPRNGNPKLPFGNFTFSGSAAIELAATAAEGQPAKRPTFKINAYNGGPMRVAGYFYPVVVDLAGMNAPAKLPILLDHDPAQIVGQANSVEIGASSINLAGIVTGDDAPALKVLAHAKNGFDWGASIGATPSKVEFVSAGESAKANGQKFNGPLLIVRGSHLRETSIMSIGADASAQTSIAARAAGVTDMEFSDWLKAQGWNDESKLSDQQKKSLRAAFDAEVKAGEGGEGEDENGSGSGKKKPAPKPPIQASGAADEDDPGAKHRDLEAAETLRIAAIRKHCDGKHPDVEAKAIKEKWTPDATELHLMRAERPKPPAVHSKEDNAEGSVIEAALCISGGMSPEFLKKRGADEKTLNAACGREYRGFGLHAFMYEVLRAAGKHVRPGVIGDDFIRATFEADRELRASGFSTISLSGILGNVLNKRLLQSFEAVPSAAVQICSQVDFNDFKQMTSYRMTGVGAFKEVGPGGELPSLSLSEESYTNQVTTKGAMLALTRTMQINDDLGALLKIPAIIGRQSALAVELAVFKLLLSNPNNFFHANNKNYDTGAGTALSINSLTTGLAAFRNQVDTNGDPIVVNPAVLLVHPGNEVLAGRIFKETILNETTTADAGKPRNNPFVGMFRPVTSPYPSNANITGYSTTAWYLFADPNDCAAMEIAYLRGQRTPVIEQGALDFDTLGVGFRGYFDFGVGMQDPKAAYKAKGAA